MIHDAVSMPGQYPTGNPFPARYAPPGAISLRWMAKQVNMAEGESRESIRGQYERFGVQAFYERAGSSYRNPHEPAIREALRQSVDRWQPDLRSVLDLACGSGEVTLALRETGGATVTGIDPYTGAAYFERTGQQAEALAFEQISTGILAERCYSL